MSKLTRCQDYLLLVVSALLALGLLIGTALLLSRVHTVRADPGVIYVDAAATGVATGLTWTDAFTNVQDALGDAGSGDEIWVATGVYYPDVGALQTAGDRYATFALVPGVALYGGFSGGETGRDERDWEGNVTVLSGDIGGDDLAVDGVVTDTDAIRGDNAYQVVTALGVTETAVLDGFAITAGDANGRYLRDNGAGVLNDESSPSLTNVLLSGNRAAGLGGGMYILGGSSRPTLTNVTFRGNEAAGYGGGMYTVDGSPTLTDVTLEGNRASRGGGMYNDVSSLQLTGVRLSGNEATGDGGGMYNHRSVPTLTNAVFNGNQAGMGGGGMYSHGEESSPALTNVVFSGNAAQDGGGMYNAGYSGPALTNATFSGNRADGSGGGMYNDTSTPSLVNCILWANGATTGGQIYSVSSMVTVTYSDVEGGHAGTGNIDADPQFVAPAAAADAPTTGGDYRLGPGSPAIDAGDNGAVEVILDLDGNPRVADGDGDGDAVVDMGAYEVQAYPLTVVKAGSGDGTVVGDPPGIDCGATCVYTYSEGMEVTLEAAPAVSSTFAGWSGAVEAITSPVVLTVDAAKTVTATFEVRTYVITPTAGVGGSIEPGMPQEVEHGEDQAFAIAAEEGYEIAEVVVDGVSQGAVEGYTFYGVTEDHTIEAEFGVRTYVITPTAGVGGSIEPGTPQVVRHGEDQGFGIAAEEGFAIAAVVVDGVSQGAVEGYTFYGVTADHTISVEFAVSGAPHITSADGVAFVVGGAGRFTVMATGVPTPTLVCSGTLPAGVAFTDEGDGTGTLAGTPEQGTVGEYALTFTASNGLGPDARQQFTLTVMAAEKKVYLPVVVSRR